MRNERVKMLGVWLFIVSGCVLFLPTLAQSQQAGPVTLSILDGIGPPGTTKRPVTISLDNPDDRVAPAFLLELCRGGNLTPHVVDPLDPFDAKFEMTPRTDPLGSWFCSIDSDDLAACDTIGCVLLGLDPIDVGTGPIITLFYDVSLSAPMGSTALLTLQLVNPLLDCVDRGDPDQECDPPQDPFLPELHHY